MGSTYADLLVRNLERHCGLALAEDGKAAAFGCDDVNTAAAVSEMMEFLLKNRIFDDDDSRQECGRLARVLCLDMDLHFSDLKSTAAIGWQQCFEVLRECGCSVGVRTRMCNAFSREVSS